MPQATAIVVNDREDTPVAHTFAPRDKVGNLWTFSEGASIAAGDGKITVSWSSDQTYKRKVRMKVILPVVVTDSDTNRDYVQHTPFFDGTFVLPGESTAQERENLVGIVANALASGQLIPTMIEDGEGIY